MISGNVHFLHFYANEAPFAKINSQLHWTIWDIETTQHWGCAKPGVGTQFRSLPWIVCTQVFKPSITCCLLGGTSSKSWDQKHNWVLNLDIAIWDTGLHTRVLISRLNSYPKWTSYLQILQHQKNYLGSNSPYIPQPDFTTCIFL